MSENIEKELLEQLKLKEESKQSQSYEMGEQEQYQPPTDDEEQDPFEQESPTLIQSQLEKDGFGNTETLTDYLEFIIKKHEDKFGDQDETILVLDFFKYRVQNVVNRFFEAPQKYSQQSQKILWNVEKQDQNVLTNEICFVCYTDPGIQIRCGCILCTACITNLIKDQLKLQTGMFPCLNCPAILAPSLVKTILKGNQKDLDNYQVAFTYNMVEKNPFLKWCPSPGCQYAVFQSDINIDVGHCKCGREFCFNKNCVANMKHELVTCDEMAKWVEQNDKGGDYFVNIWLKKNGKECPRCHYQWEQNQGCQHLTCKQCQYQFCQACSEIWNSSKPHYNCNNWKPKSSSKQEEKQLELFAFYSEKYNRHKGKIQLILQKNDQKLSILLEKLTKELSLVDFKRIKDSLSLLFKINNLIMSGYIRAYFQQIEGNVTESHLRKVDKFNFGLGLLTFCFEVLLKSIRQDLIQDLNNQFKFIENKAEWNGQKKSIEKSHLRQNFTQTEQIIHQRYNTIRDVYEQFEKEYSPQVKFNRVF